MKLNDALIASKEILALGINSSPKIGGQPFEVFAKVWVGYHSGMAREDIFFEDEGRRHFLGLVEEGVIRFRHRIQAFCLMANHVLQLDSRIVKPDPDSFRSEVSLKIISIKLLFLKYFLLI